MWKRLELSRPPCPIKQHLRQRRIITGSGTASFTTQQWVSVSEPRPGPSVSEGLASLIDQVVTMEETSDLDELLTHNSSWPERGKLPPVRDLVTYQHTLPRNITSREIGELDSLKFGQDQRLRPRLCVSE